VFVELMPLLAGRTVCIGDEMRAELVQMRPEAADEQQCQVWWYTRQRMRQPEAQRTSQGRKTPGRESKRAAIEGLASCAVPSPTLPSQIGVPSNCS
jgi:hypothetical protein